MIRYKEESKQLVANKSLVLVNDEETLTGNDSNLVWRRAVKTFASRCGRSSIWGVVFDKPLSDGTIGVAYNLIREVR